MQPEEKAETPESFSSTMRIDITPHLKEQLGTFGPAVAPRKPGKITIRIPRKPGEGELGSPDFQEFLQNVYDATLITDLQGRIATVNPRAIQFFRADRSELTGRRIIDLISGADESLVPVILQNLENDRFTLIQAYCIRSDGTIFPAEISANRLHISGRDYLSFFIRDITWRKEAEERLRTGATAIQNSGGGIAVADVQGRIGFCNPAMSSLWGLPAPDLMVGRSLHELLADPGRADEILAAIAERRSWAGELELRRADGATLYAQAAIVPNVNADDELTGMVLSVLDITALKQTQYQLECYARELQEKNELLESDQNMAREIQLAFLPQRYPVFPPGCSPEDSALRIAHRYIPSGAVGGDFFDVLAISDNRAGFFISDVSGHGMRAALVVATLRGLIEELGSLAEDPGPFLTQLNRAYNGILGHTEQVTFTTVFYMVLDLSTGLIRYTTAGHPLPFLLNRRAQSIAVLPAQGEGKGPALGLFDGAVYQSSEAMIEPGDILLLYTDGISEAEGPGGEMFEDARMEETLRSSLPASPEELLDRLINDATAFRGSRVFDDDVCLLAVEWVRKLAT